MDCFWTRVRFPPAPPDIPVRPTYKAPVPQGRRGFSYSVDQLDRSTRPIDASKSLAKAAQLSRVILLRGEISRRGTVNSLIVLRALQITTVRVAEIAALARRSRFAVLILSRRRRSGELHLRMLVELELIVEDAAGDARRVLRESKVERSEQRRCRNGCGTHFEDKFHGRSARRARMGKRKSEYKVKVSQKAPQSAA